jgi:hypothetical protein
MLAVPGDNNEEYGERGERECRCNAATLVHYFAGSKVGYIVPPPIASQFKVACITLDWQKGVEA